MVGYAIDNGSNRENKNLNNIYETSFRSDFLNLVTIMWVLPGYQCICMDSLLRDDDDDDDDDDMKG
jgi:DhnA family fructose-bisphosphate aldolase class Ia